MSKLHTVQVTGDKVEVVEWVGERPDIAKYAHLVPYVTYVNDMGDYVERCKNATRYATNPSDRDFWLAKQGEVFGEDCFTVDCQAHYPLFPEKNRIYAIPRKEDDVDLWDVAFNECYKQFATTLDHSYIMRLCMDYLKQHYSLTKKK